MNPDIPTELVALLRWEAQDSMDPLDVMCREAADEIERLTNIIEGYDYEHNGEIAHWVNKQKRTP